MKHVFTLTRFETRADRPLFTGDAGAYVLRVVLPEEVENGVLTAASFRPDTENPVLSSTSFSGNTAEVTLVTGQYDKEGETKILCTVTDGEGDVLTTRVLYATVLTGIAGGTVGKDDYTQLTQLISLAGEAVSDCSSAVSAAESAISSCQDAASRAEQAVSEIPAVPTKVSELENDSGYLKDRGSGAYISYGDGYDIDIAASAGVSIGTGGTVNISGRNGTVFDSESEVSADFSGKRAANLSAPEADTDAANKKYVDDNKPTKTSELENDSDFLSIPMVNDSPVIYYDKNLNAIRIGSETVNAYIGTRLGTVDIASNTNDVTITAGVASDPAGGTNAKLKLSSIGGTEIQNVVTPTEDTDAANKKYVDDSIPTDYLSTSIGDTQTVETYGSGELYIVTSRGGQLFIGGDADTVYMTGLKAPTSDSDATNKAYVDSAIASAITATLSTAV